MNEKTETKSSLDRKVLAAGKLSDETLKALKTTKMDDRHLVLNALMREEQESA